MHSSAVLQSARLTGIFLSQKLMDAESLLQSVLNFSHLFSFEHVSFLHHISLLHLRDLRISVFVNINYQLRTHIDMASLMDKTIVVANARIGFTLTSSCGVNQQLKASHFNPRASQFNLELIDEAWSCWFKVGGG